MKKETIASGDYLVYFHHPHNNVQRIYEECDIPINVHKSGR